MYDNETGRFTTPDLLWSAFPAQTPYHYAYNSPLTYRDPSGLAPEKEKEGEELQNLEIDWEYWEGIWNEIIRENDRRSPQGMTNADGSLMMNEIEESKSYGSTHYKGGRTAEASSCYNGMDAMGNTSYKMTINYSNGDFVNFNINFNVGDNITLEEQEKYVEQHVADTNTILQADVTFFDGFLYGTFDVDITRGQVIAAIYNSTNPEVRVKQGDILLGLRSNDVDGRDKFYLSTEGLDGDGGIYYTTGDNSYWQSWEIWAHEFGHAVGRNEYGSIFYGNTLNYFGREWDTTRRLNLLRSHYNLSEQIFRGK